MRGLTRRVRRLPAPESDLSRRHRREPKGKREPALFKAPNPLPPRLGIEGQYKNQLIRRVFAQCSATVSFSA
ncbi:hypothetical protein [Symbioplanes lichenis]|uniref:hypothetical protein n=1 Tax=Symbioplanes lichenis TaxID=1629072 RepID=UPI002739DAC4|nr:hypothetical protein [Actinoplanes lichenis]